MIRHPKGTQRLALNGLLLLLLPLAATSETFHGRVFYSDSGHFQLAIIDAPAPLPINRIHSWSVHLQDDDGTALTDATITLTGGMPEHDHGLPTAPRVTTELSPGTYLVEGLKFHMHGAWTLTFAIRSKGVSDPLTIEFTL